MPLKIMVPSGIGDFLWAYSKLVNLKIPLHVDFAGSTRAVPLVEMLEFVAQAQLGKFSYAQVKNNTIKANTPVGFFATRAETKVPFYVEVNTHLEAGNRIETWIPQLPVCHHYPITIAPQYVGAVEPLLPKQKYICVYASAMSTVKAWKAWAAHEWFAFMKDIRTRIADVPFVLIGASWDAELSAQITALATQHGLKCTNLVGKLHLASSVHVMKRAVYTIAFPSGMGVLAHAVKAPATMFYAEVINKLIGTWTNPEQIKSLAFSERVFCPPVVFVTWLITHYQLHLKLLGK